MKRQYVRAFVIWPVFVVVAIINGLFRESVLNPLVGMTAGHILSSVMLAVLIIVAAYLLLKTTISEYSPVELWRVGGMWLVLTIAFEFLFGRYVAQNSWDDLLRDYNIFAGRTWVLVLLAVAVAPRLARSFAVRRT